MKSSETTSQPNDLPTTRSLIEKQTKLIHLLRAKVE